jgi:hypothetical protein
MPRGFDFGFVGGVDVLKLSDTPRGYLGIVLDFSGFGFTFAASSERYGSVPLPAGTFIPSGTNAQVDYSAKWGFLAALTTDADIFQAIFKNYIQSANFPTTAPPGGF